MALPADIQTPMFRAALFMIAKRQKHPEHPLMDAWINKMQAIQTMEYYSALRRKEILTCATMWMNLEDVMFSGISQTPKDKQCVIPLI